MSENIFDQIKKQIEDQSKAPLNTDINSIQIQAVSAGGNDTPVVTSDIISPQWTVGEYILQRKLDFLTPDKFLDYSGAITWKTVDSRSVTEADAAPYTNMLFGIQLYSSNDIVLEFRSSQIAGALAAYVKTDDNYVLVWSSKNTRYTSFQIPLQINTWTTLVLVYYTEIGSSFVAFGADYKGVNSWRHLNVSAPSVPTWASTPVSYEVVQGDIARGKNVLTWKKNKDINFVGNNIYRRNKNFGVNLVRPLTGTLLTNVAGYTDKNKWVVSDVSGTINSGDSTSFHSGVTGTHIVSDIFYTPINYVSNPNFNTNYNWTFSTGTIKTTQSISINQRGNSSFNLDVVATNSKYSITSTFIAVNASIHYMGFVSSNNLLDKTPYDLEGFKATPSRWTVSGLTITSTIHENLPMLEVLRTDTNGFIYSNSQSPSFYLTTTASYSLSCSASFTNLDGYKLSMITSAGTCYSSPTLSAGNNKLVPSTVLFTPSISATAYLKITVLGTVPASSEATVLIGYPSIVSTPVPSLARECFKVEFYDGAKAALPTALATFQLYHHDSIYSVTERYAIGTFNKREEVQFPVGCEYFKVGYFATIDSTTSTISIDRLIHTFYTATLNQNLNYCIFATNHNLIRFNSTIATTSAGASLYFEKYDLIASRKRQADDGDNVTFEDYNIENNTLYSYYLSAYDNSPFSNDSQFSVVASLTSGDTIAPKPPSSYTLEGFKGGIKHNWVNPTATDLRRVRCVTVASYVLFEMDTISPGGTNSLTELIDSPGLATRHLKAIDSFGNVSTSIVATCSVLPKEDAYLPFTVVIRTTAGTLIGPTDGGWFGQTVTGSILPENNFAVASYLTQLKIEETGSGWSSWASGPGVITATTNYKLRYRFKIKDIYDNFSDIKEVSFNIDKIAPTILDTNGFWSAQSSGLPGSNLLVWNGPSAHDRYDQAQGYDSSFTRSGIKEIHLRRTQINNVIANPLFKFNSGKHLDDWSNYAPSTCVASLYSANSYNGSQCLQIKTLKSGPGIIGGLSKPFWGNENDHFNLTCRVFPSLTSTSTLLLKVVTALNGSEVIDERFRINNSATFQYYNVAGTLTTGRSPGTPTLYIAQILWRSVSLAATDDFVLADEITGYIDTVSATLDILSPETQSYFDQDVSPWNHYLYELSYLDNVGNLSSQSPKKYLQTIADNRDKYRNMLDNSSFERTYESASGTLLAFGWEPKQYGSVPLSKDIKNPYEVRRGDPFQGNGFHGINFAVVGDSPTNNRLFQNDVHLLPFTGDSRKYVLSGYFRAPTTSNTHFFGLIAYNNEAQLVSSKTFTLSNVGTVWIRTTGTFTASVASITSLSCFIFGGSSGSLYADAIQLEEKEDIPATDYYDTKSVTVDFLSTSLLRGHMIESESIIAENIKVRTLTATQIQADTITTNELNLAGANLLIKRNIISPDIYNQSTATLTNVNLCTGTYVGTGFLKYYTISSWVKTGGTENIIGETNQFFAGAATMIGTPATFFTNYISGYPLISAPWGASSSKKILALSYSSSGSLYGAYASMSNNRTGLNAERWSTPIDLSATSGVVPFRSTTGGLVSYNDKYYWCGPSLRNRFVIVKMDQTGAVLATYGRNYTLITFEPSVDLTISNSGTMLVAYRSTSAARCVALSTMGVVTSATVSMPNYSGTSVYLDGDMPATKSAVDKVSICYLNDDKYMVTKQYNYIDNYIYHNMIDGTGAIKTGSDVDLPVISQHITPQHPIGSLQIRHMSVTSRGGRGVCYIPSTGKYLSGPLNNTSIGLSATEVQKVPATINLEELLNETMR